MWWLLLWVWTGAAERKFVPEEGPRSAAAAPSALVDGGSWDARVQQGARQLGLRFDFVRWCREGLDLLYRRRYRDARTLFAELNVEYPGTAVSPIADLLVWQAMMLENFDQRYASQYQAASDKAHAELDAAAGVAGNDGWEQFMLAGVIGLEAIHAARNGRYLPALTKAFEAFDHVHAVRAVAPAFVDLQLADGLYNYWRTVLAQESSLIPDFGDHRAEGIAQIQVVERDGIFLAAPATLSMVFTWLQEKDYDKALSSCDQNHARYPGNVINELLRGYVQLHRRAFTDALATFDKVRQLDPENVRVRYYRGVALLRLERHDEARQEMEFYLAQDYLQEYQRAAAFWRLGDIYEHLGRYADAELQYKAGAKLGEASAKAALEKLYEKRRDGMVTW